MKISRIFGGSLLSLLLVCGATSCKSGEQRLADNLVGIWAGTPEAFTDNQAVSATITDTYCFEADSTTVSRQPSGPVLIQGMITLSTQIVPEGTEIQPLSLTAAAVSTIKGRWTAVDDDEVALALDVNSLKVIVDPQQVVAGGGMIGTDGAPRTDSISSALAANIERSLRMAVAERYAGNNVMDDVKIKGSLLKYEVGHKDYVLTRQTENLSK